MSYLQIEELRLRRFVQFEGASDTLSTVRKMDENAFDQTVERWGRHPGLERDRSLGWTKPPRASNESYVVPLVFSAGFGPLKRSESGPYSLVQA
jgi:hypothetical protein